MYIAYAVFLSVTFILLLRIVTLFAPDTNIPHWLSPLFFIVRFSIKHPDSNILNVEFVNVGLAPVSFSLLFIVITLFVKSPIKYAVSPSVNVFGRIIPVLSKNSS